MSLFNVFNVAGSGLNAETIRLNTTASNLANAESVNGDLTKVYRARHPVFQAMMDTADTSFDDQDAGVGSARAGIVESTGTAAEDLSARSSARRQGRLRLQHRTSIRSKR
jgi:flagellar basal-body rod protein FlgC